MSDVPYDNSKLHLRIYPLQTSENTASENYKTETYFSEAHIHYSSLALIM